MKVSKKFIFLLLFIAPFLFTNRIDQTYIFETFLASLFLVAMTIFFIFFNIDRKDGSVLDITFWVFVYIFIGMVSIIQMNANEIPWVNFSKYSYLSTQAIIIFIIGVFSFIFGRYSKLKIDIPDREISLRSLNIFLVVNLLGLFIVLSSIGFKSLILPRVLYTSLILESGYLNILITSLLQNSWMLCLIGYIHLLKRNQISIYFLIPLILISVIYFNPIRSDRFSFFTLYIILLFSFFGFNKKLWAFLLISGLVFIFPFADIFRSLNEQVNFELSALGDNFLDGDFDAFSTVLMSIYVVKLNSYLYFANFFSPLYIYIPRQFWSSKPISSSDLITNELNINYPDIVISLWGEGFLGFGLLGVIILLYCIGVYIKSFSYLKKTNDFQHLLFFMSMPTLLFVLRGNIYDMSFKLVPILLFCLMITKKRNNFSSVP